jgi:hypothetical protein
MYKRKINAYLKKKMPLLALLSCANEKGGGYIKK